MYLLLWLPLLRPGSASPLPELSVDASTIAVSGFSSGGCFATQFHAAFSRTVQAVGTFSGCPYLSGGPAGDDVDAIVAATRELAAAGLIDPVEELAGDRVYIFQGHKDWIVPWEHAGRIHAFYSEFCTEANIEEKSDLQATHGFPSDSYGCHCDTFCPNFYINNCHYSGAAAVIHQALPASRPPSRGKPSGRLALFDQEEFYGGDAAGHSMAGEGYVYIPERCEAAGRRCHLHVNFHGCGMGSSWIGDNYIQHSGFLPVADANDVIMLFPQIQPLPSQGNGDGCWDWWGFLGDSHGYKYATRAGLQMAGVAAMVERVAGLTL